jgi:hypothetical protein
LKALLYLTLKKTRNGIVEFVKSPARLIIALIFVALLAFSAVTSGSSHALHYARDINELYALIFALYSVIFVLISKNGFYNGASMFTMQDVNLIFTSPLKQNTVLSYGLIQQLGRSLMLGFFILFQSGTVCTTYGVGFEALVYILIGYGVTVFLSQMTAMVIYSLTSSDDKKRKILKSAYTAVIFAFVSYGLYLCFTMGGITVSNLVTVAGNIAAKFFPVSGMISLAVSGAIGGRVQEIIFGLIYCIAFWCLYRVAIKLINGDYYEDVLKSTENAFSAISARKEGKAAENAPRNVKTGKTGITKGFGAAVIAQKHKIENRRSRKFILSTMSLVQVVITTVTCFVFSSEPVAVFALSVYMMTMSIASGRWAKELSYPYIYLIPESSYKKLLYMVKNEIPTAVLESILCCVPIYFICYLSVADTLGMILARISFAFLLIAVNLLLQRIFGESDKKKLIVMFYFFLILLFSIPGIFAAFAVYMIMPFYLGIAMTAMAVVNTLVALILAFFCRKIFEVV